MAAEHERPRRSTRVLAKYQDKQIEVNYTTSPSIPKKRKASPTKDSHPDPSSLDFLLTNPKSPLVNMGLSKLINEHTWSALSHDSRDLLSTMLPPTAFPFFRPSLNPNHPANKQISEEATESPRTDMDAMALASEPDPCFFTEPFFEVGAKTFQYMLISTVSLCKDHLYSGWLTPAHENLVCEYTEKLQKGDIHAPWKDDVWSREHPIVERTISDTDGLAGEASSITLKDLVKHSIICVGDVLAYRRHFSQPDCTVAKDALIYSVHPGHSLTVLVPPSTQIHLPLSYIQYPATIEHTHAENPVVPLQSMEITNPSQLENAILDINGSIHKSRRRNANAWKSFSLWRWRDREVPDPSIHPQDTEEATRGYREYRGSLFYLRGCFYDDF